jgi:predicted dehydrogenase
MSKKNISIGIIGAGLRSAVTKLLFENDSRLKLKGIFDPDKERAKERVNMLGFPDATICESSEELTNCPELDWIMIFSPNSCHAEHILAALSNNKHVFTEKPMATTMEDCEKVFKAYTSSECQLATGFVLRYAPIYRKAKELLDAGAIGKILSIDANENLSVELGSFIMRNWRRKREQAGPYLLEKCCHDLDLLNWFTGSVPSRVASFGGLDFFLPENKSMEKKYTDKNGTNPFTAIPDSHGADSPFTSDKDIVDNQVAILEYRNNVRVMFQSVLSNAIHERRMYIAGTEGTMILELFSGKIIVKKIGDESTNTFETKTGDGHGGGDQIIMQELYETMCGNIPPKSSGTQGLESAIVALAIDKARNDGLVFNLEPIWQGLGR